MVAGALPRWLLGFALLLALLVSTGCGTTNRAPVVNREPGSSIDPSRSPIYQVQPGDTLYAIAWQAGLDYRELAAWNGIRNPGLIRVGQQLRLQPPPRKGTQKQVNAGKPAPRVASKAPPPKPKPKSAATQVPAPAPKVVASKPKPKAAGKSKVASKPKTVAPKAASKAKLAWRWPTQGRVVERFSAKDRARNGVKIAGQSGQSIHAAEAGRIVYSGSGLIGYGKLIIIKHNKNYLSAYGHNRKILVKEGDQVARGERIAEMGKPLNDQPLLHFEIRRQGVPVDPLQLLPKKG